MVFLLTTATTELKTTIAVIYVAGVLIYSGLLSIFFNLMLRKKVTFILLLIHSFVGALIGAFLAITIFSALDPIDIVYGQPDWEEKMDFQVRLANFCILVPIGSILLASIYSIKNQLKKSVESN